MNRRTLPPVLFLADKFGYPSGVSFGGTTYFVNVLPALAHAGVNLTACFLRDPHPAAQALRERGVQPRFLSVHKWNPWVAPAVARVARERDCGIIHAAGVKATIVARMAARIWPMRVLVHVHDLVHPGPILGAVQRSLSEPTDIGICVSKAVMVTTRDGYHVEPGRLRVVPNGLDLAKFRDVPPDCRARVRKALGIDPTRPILGMFARMYPVKGHRVMLEMMREIAMSNPDALLLLAGDGPERQACERLVDDYQLRGRVMFLGQRDDIPRLLTAADLFLMPSESEGLPLAAIEAMAIGVPVVGFDVGGMSEVIEDDVDGYVVPAGDRRRFVGAVQTLLQDRARLASFGVAARHAADRFSVEAHVDGVLRCYGEAVADLPVPAGAAPLRSP